MQQEMEEVFAKKVEEKEARLRAGEEEEREQLEREAVEVAREREEVDRAREQLAREREAWAARTPSLLAQRSASSSSLSVRRKHLSLNILPFKFGRS
jgi:FtsZ-binding cell division protein ZapB